MSGHVWSALALSCDCDIGRTYSASHLGQFSCFLENISELTYASFFLFCSVLFIVNNGKNITHYSIIHHVPLNAPLVLMNV